MKPRFTLLALPLVIALHGHASAAPVNKDTDGTDLTATGSWVGDVIPGSGDVATWASGTALGGALTIDSNLSWQGIDIQAATAAITTSGAGVLTLGSSGINIASGGVNLTIGNSRTFSASSNITVGSGRILTLNGGTGITTTFADGTITTLNGAGEVTFSGQPNAFAGTGALVVSSGILRNNLQAAPTTLRTGATTLQGGAAYYQNSTANLLGSGTLTIGTGGAITGGGTGANGARTISNAITLNATLTVQNEGSSNSQTTLSGNISGGGGIVKNSTGSGSLILSGTNSYTGLTTVNAGTLSLTGSLSGSNVTTAGTGIISQTSTGSIAGTGVTFTQASSGTSVLGGTNSYTGSTTVNAGTLSLTGSLSGSNVTTAGTGIISQTSAGSIAGSGVTFTQASSGTSVLGGTNTYTGLTTVNAGTLSVTGSISSSSTLAVGGGTFSYAKAAAQTVNGLTVNAGSSVVTNTNTGITNILNLGAITRSAGGGIVNFSNASAANNVITTSTANTNGILGTWATIGANWATNDGSGNIVAYSGYTDVTRLESGTKSIADNSTSNVRVIDGTGSSPANITLAASTTAVNTLLQSATGGSTTIDAASSTLRVGGIRLVSGASALTIGTALNSGTLTAASAAGELIVINDASNALTINSTLANNTSASSLTKLGAGTLILNGTNTYSGGTTLSAGTLQVGHANALGSNTLTISGGSLTSGSTQLALANNITLNSGVILTGTAGTQGMRLNGVISGIGGITKEGTGRVTIVNDSLSTPNTFTGSTTVSAGILAISLNALASSASVTLGSAGTLAVGSNGTTTINNLSGAASSTILTGFNIVSDGLRALKINQSTNGTYAGIIDEGGTTRAITLIKSGTASLTLGSTSDHTGGTTLSQGTLVAANSSALGASGTVTINDTNTGSNNTTLNIDATGGAITIARAISVANQGSGTVTLGSATTSGSNAAIFSGAITLAKDLTLNGGSVGDRFSTTGGISGTGNVTIAGTSRVLFVGTTNTYNGSTSINAGATLQLSDGTVTATSFIPDGSAVTVNNGGFLKLAKGGNSETIGALTGNGTVEALSGNDTLVVGSGDATSGFGGSLKNNGGTLSLTKTGAGTLTLSGTGSNYTGATTVSGGTLVINGNISTSSLTTVQSGATIGGSGTVGALSVLAGGILAPGTSPGTLNTGTLTLANTSISSFELNPSDFTVGLGINDFVSVSGNLTLDGILNVLATSGDFLSVIEGTSWRLFNYSGSLTDNTLTLGTMPALGTGLGWSVNTATAGQVNLVVVPEPGAALLGGLGLLCLLRRRR